MQDEHTVYGDCDYAADVTPAPETLPKASNAEVEPFAQAVPVQLSIRRVQDASAGQTGWAEDRENEAYMFDEDTEVKDNVVLVEGMQITALVTRSHYILRAHVKPQR
jgi:hypothetical protein